jgi:hypothetical protein
MASKFVNSASTVCKVHVVRCENSKTPLAIMSLTPVLFPRQISALRIGMAEMELIIARASAQEVRQ